MFLVTQTRRYRHLVEKPAEQRRSADVREEREKRFCFSSRTTEFVTPPVGPSKASQAGRMFYWTQEANVTQTVYMFSSDLFRLFLVESVMTL